MKIAIASDGKSPAIDKLIQHVTNKGHEVICFGAIVDDPNSWNWPAIAMNTAKQVADETVDQAIVICWTGTGVSIAANKIEGVRAALCTDAETAKGARTWNDANVLALSQRLLTEKLAMEITDAWFEEPGKRDENDRKCLDELSQY